MSLRVPVRVLLVLAMALAGCGAKSTTSNVADPAAAADVTSGQAPLGSGSTTSPDTKGATGAPSGLPQATTSPPGQGQAPGAVGTTNPGQAQGTTTSGSSSSTATSSPTSGTTSSSTSTSSSPTSIPTTGLPTGTGGAPTSTPSSTPTSTPTLPPPPPFPLASSCGVALAGLHGLGPIGATSAMCAPSAFVSSSGASFTHVAVQVTQGAALLPSAVLVQILDTGGSVIASATGLGTLQITVPTAQVPTATTLPLSAFVALTGIFTDYSATLAFTVS